METTKAKVSSPLSTVDQIQRRLLRPPSLLSLSSTSSAIAREDIMKCYSPHFEGNSGIEPQRKMTEITNKRLEDYLDPALLSAIRARIGVKRKRGGEIKRKELEFEWPIDELKVLREDLRSEKGMKWRSDDAIDLGDDVDVIGDEDEVRCTPFQRFERTTLKRFKG